MIPMDERAFMEYRGKNGVAPMIRTSKKDLATDLVASMNCSLARETMYIYIYIERTKENDRDRYCSYDLTIVLVLLLFLLKFPFSRLGSSGFVCKSIKQEITTIDFTNISSFKIQQIFNSSLAEI